MDNKGQTQAISQETRAILLRLYALHDQIASAVIRAGADTLYSAHGVALDALNDADRLCDDLENVFSEYLTPNERGMTED